MTRIEWTDEVVNPVGGCSKWSDGCASEFPREVAVEKEWQQ